MDGSDWASQDRVSLGVFLNGDAMDARDGATGRPHDASFLLLVNASAHDVAFQLPRSPWAQSYVPMLDTAAATGEPASSEPLAAHASLDRPGRSLLVLRANR
jgi:glycogen operon protein